MIHFSNYIFFPFFEEAEKIFLILNTKESKEYLHIMRGKVVIYKKSTRSSFFEIRIDS